MKLLLDSLRSSAKRNACANSNLPDASYGHYRHRPRPVTKGNKQHFGSAKTNNISVVPNEKFVLR